MSDATVRERLRAFTDAERRAKEIFEIHGSSIADPEGTIRVILPEIAIALPPHGAATGPDRLPESLVMRDGADVAVLKHPRYLPAAVHVHEFIELTYVYEGHCGHTVAGVASTMARGDLVMIPPNVTHSLSVVDDQTIAVNILVRRTTFDQVFFRLLAGDDLLADFFADLIYAGNRSRSAILFRTGDDLGIRDLVERLYDEAAAGRRYRSRMLNILVAQLFTSLMRDHDDRVSFLGPSPAANDSRVYRAVRLVQRDWQTATLEGVAHELGYSSSYTSRLIKRATGRSFTEIVRELRMRRSMELLGNPAIAVDEIAASSGYADASHFYRAFRAMSGVTPGEYRRQLMEARMESPGSSRGSQLAPLEGPAGRDVY